MTTNAANSNFALMDKALVAGESFLVGAPKLAYIFKTNASGGLDELPEKDTHAYNLVECIAFACGGINLSFLNEALPQLELAAIDMGRDVTRRKKDNEYFTIISAIPG